MEGVKSYFNVQINVNKRENIDGTRRVCEGICLMMENIMCRVVISRKSVNFGDSNIVLSFILVKLEIYLRQTCFS